jgi:phenylpropionate dioxygenase-like ring-hydroxylating dioxygenase large terminal subunit
LTPTIRSEIIASPTARRVVSVPQLGDFVSKAEIRALYRPTAKAEGLPARAYREGFYRVEQEQLFPRAWCAVGVASEIPSPGDAMPVDLAGWPLALVRQRDGNIAAFHNVCRHRGMRLLPAPCKGRAVLRCPWHSWTYDLAGRLVATPDLGGDKVRAAPGFDFAELGLRQVRLARWQDYLFVNIDGKAPEFADHIRPFQRFLGGYDLSVMRHGGRWEGSYPGNWKIAVEGAIEDYHLPWGHPELMQGVAARNARVDFAEHCFAAVSGRFEYPTGQGPALTRLKRAMPSMPVAPPAEPERYFVINLFPVGLVTLRADTMMLGLFTPDGPERTRLVFHHYFAGEAASDPAFARQRQEIVDNLAYVAEQDIGYVAGVQSNLATRDRLDFPTRFSAYWEGGVQHFQKMVVETIRGKARRAARAAAPRKRRAAALARRSRHERRPG